MLGAVHVRVAALTLCALCVAPAQAAAPPSATPASTRPTVQCGTPALMRLLRHGTAAANIGITARPTDAVGSVAGSALPIRVHYAAAEQQALASAVLLLVEEAWALEVDGAGFPAPLADSGRGGDDMLDVYLEPLPSGIGALTVAEDDAAPADGKHGSPAFIKVDPSLADDVMPVFIAHELNHALQFGIDTLESVAWFESSAVFWETRMRPDVHAWWDPVVAFQAEPQAPLFTDGAQFARYTTLDDPRYEYGAVLFALYLEQEYGTGDGALLRALWLASVEPDDVAENEPDWLDALPAATGSSNADVILDFSTWRALAGPYAVSGEGSLVALPPTAGLGAGVVPPSALLGRTTRTSDTQGPFATGCVVRRVTAADALPVHVEARAAVEGQELGISTVVTVPQERATRTVGPLGSNVSVDVELLAGETLFVSVCDVTDDGVSGGASDADAEPQPRPIDLVLGTPPPDAGVLDAGPADGGVVDGGDVDPPDCTCQSTPAQGQGGIPKRYRRGGGAFFMGAMLLVFTVQYIKKRQRKTLYARKAAERAARDVAEGRMPSASGATTSVATSTEVPPRDEKPDA